MKRILYMIVGLIFIFGCSDDKGNYDYRTLNKITLSGLKEDYSVDQFDTLRIDDLQLDFALEENTEMAFEWVIRRRNAALNTTRVISTDRNCRGYIEEEADMYDAHLCVTDRTNNLKYYHEFTLHVNTVWANGLFVLSEAADGTAVFSVQRRDKLNSPLKYDVFELNNPGLGQLGRKPVQICSADYSGEIAVLCLEGERKLLKIKDDDLKLLQYWDETTVEGYTGTFMPEYFSNEQMQGMVLSEGKLFLFNYAENKTLYRPIEGYRFSWVGTSPGLPDNYYAYDEESQTFKHLHSEKIALVYDKITSLDTLKTAGQTFRAAGIMKLDDYEWAQCPVLYDPATGMEHYYEIHIGGEYDYETWEYIKFFNYSKKMARPALMDDGSVCLLSKTNYWYASKGDKVIRYFFSETSTPQDWITGLKGTVTEMIFGKDESQIFVATYDGTKSYIYEIDARTAGKLVNDPIEVEGKVVSMCVVNDHKWVY